jgi:malate synthase
MPASLAFRPGVRAGYADVLSDAAVDALRALAPLDETRRAVMAERSERRRRRAASRDPIAFLDPESLISPTSIRVADARAGRFRGGPIPDDLRRQWIQGTGPAARPRATVEANLRNVAYALLSGADGWMFDGEDALGQVDAMSLDNQRSLRLAFAMDAQFLRVAEQIAGDMNAWAEGFLGRRPISDWRAQLEFTTRIFRARGLHLDDRHVRWSDGTGFSASIVDLVLYVVGNAATLRAQGRSLVLYLPKIQTAQEAALWARILDALEAHLGLPAGIIRVYVLVEQIEAAFQLLEIRAALGAHFVGFNTGRWDYINSVSDALHWDPGFANPNIEAIGMTYSYMRAYEDRVRRAVNTPDADGQCALWQGGMEAQIPVGTERGVDAAMRKAVAGAEREQREGASGKWVAHWKMVHIVRPVWEGAGEDNQLGRRFPALTHTDEDAAALTALEPALRTVRGARDLLSVGLQYGNAFLRGFQAAALKPADFFGDGDVLYLMEDMATGEIRLSILWEWLHKQAAFTEDDPDTGIRTGDPLTIELFDRLLAEERAKLLAASNRDVHDDSKTTSLPVAFEIVGAYVRSGVKPPWYIDLLNRNLGNDDAELAARRGADYLEALARGGTRLTAPADFDPLPNPIPDPP